MSKCMAVNAGSSSIKYKLYEMPEEKVICSGLVERIGHDDGHFVIKFNGEKKEETLPLPDHSVGVERILKALLEFKIIASYDEIKAVGHRVVQGGKYFSKSAYFNKDTEDKITKLIPLDPLHAPAHLMGFHAFKDALPEATAIAVFDTAFHQSMEPEDYLFPIPYEFTEKYDCRRYGAHGTSHNYIAIEGEKYVKDTKDKRIISCHLGSGASLCAIKNGKCVATSMGLTPLGGIMMGTRSGDIDPSVYYYLCDEAKLPYDEVYDILNKKSGFLGVSGVSNDTRDVEEAAAKGNERAQLSIDLWARRVADFIGSYYVRLGGADLIAFTAGVGENSAKFREEVLKRIEESLALKIDYEKNNELHGKEGLISKEGSVIKVAIIPTDEEVMIARDCMKALEGTL
ncbi:MAG: acetate kinase [Bacilli bacterium]|nr:acetate kinase [Bacilli bacterium]